MVYICGIMIRCCSGDPLIGIQVVRLGGYSGDIWAIFARFDKDLGKQIPLEPTACNLIAYIALMACPTATQANSLMYYIRLVSVTLYRCGSLKHWGSVSQAGLLM